MRPIMLQGCTSDAGKSLLTAGLCRALVNRGLHVAPFKAQNMSNFAAISDNGGEIGRAQWLQAKACRVRPHTDMNPVLIKPEADNQSQVIVNGQVDPSISRLPWMARKDKLWPAVTSALSRLLAQNDVVVIEGAGSPAEVNLRAGDIVNMAVALHCQAQVELVVDIHRGGAYAHLLGTWQCLSDEEQALVSGFVLNMFRGDQSLLAPANEWLWQQTGVEVSACVPYWPHQLPDEDSWRHQGQFIQGQTNIAVLVYPYASNLDELDVLIGETSVNLVAIRSQADLTGYDAVILPGSKNTQASLAWLQATGLDRQVANVRRRFGICGGMQILGETLQSENGQSTLDGLAYLPINTHMQADKVTQLTETICENGHLVQGYEIHHGQTTGQAIAHLGDGLGWRHGEDIGVYLHDIFTNDDYRQWWLASLGWQGTVSPFAQRIDQELDRLADLLERTGWVEHVLAQQVNKGK